MIVDEAEGRINSESTPILTGLMSLGGQTLSAHSARPRKIPGWLVLVRENTSVNKRAYRK